MVDDSSTPTDVIIDGPAQASAALAELLAGARRRIDWYSPIVIPALHDQAAVTQALRQVVLDQPRLQGRLLLPPAGQWRGHCPVLAQLIDRLGALALRVIPKGVGEDQPEHGQSFVIVDHRPLLVLSDPRRLHGRYYPVSGGYRGRNLLNWFDTLWQQAPPDTELRKLGI